MAKKLKLLLLGILTTASLTVLVPSTLLADNWGQDAQSSQASSSKDTTPDACKRYSGGIQAACINCYAKNAASDCTCHPEYQIGGQPLTPSQFTNCEACNNQSNAQVSGQKCLANNPVVKDINMIVDALAGLVAVVAVIMIVVGGIRYSLGRNDPGAIGSARKHIINAVVALIAFFLIWAVLQWLVPGGVFNS